MTKHIIVIATEVTDEAKALLRAADDVIVREVAPKTTVMHGRQPPTQCQHEGQGMFPCGDCAHTWRIHDKNAALSCRFHIDIVEAD